ncbi:MAG: hypothetical protein JNK65_03735 [Deltaproteobacteria bacterium]|nr:hypothetical protein [Deltaproteobacteria bacterium]
MTTSFLRTSNDSLLQRLSQSSLETGLTPTQAAVDQSVTQTSHELSSFQNAALLMTGTALLGRANQALAFSRLSAFSRASSVGMLTESSLNLSHLTAGIQRYASAGLAILAFPILGIATLSGCSGPNGPEDAGAPNASRITAAGNEFPLNQTPNTGTSQGLALSVGADGRMVAAWADLNLSNPSATGVFVRSFDANGNGGDIGIADQPNASVALMPSISSNSSGNFVASWTTSTGPDTPSSVRVRRFNSAGQAVGPILDVVAPEVRSVLPNASIVSLEDRGFAIVSNENSATCGACVRFFNADTSAGSVVPLVPAGTSVATSAVGNTTQGQWVWAGMLTNASGQSEIRFQRFNGRNPVGPVTTSAVGSLGVPAVVRVATLPNGRSMVVWQTNTQLSGQIFDTDGTPMAAPFRVRSVPAGQGFSVASDERGSFVVAWEEAGHILANVFHTDGTALSETAIDVSGGIGNNREPTLSGSTREGASRLTIGWRRFSGGANNLLARTYQIQY